MELVEGMLQKLIVVDTSLKLTNTGQEDVKFSLERSLKSLSEQLSKDRYQDNLQQIFLVLSTLPKQMEMFLYKLQNELCTTFTKEIQARNGLQREDPPRPKKSINHCTSAKGLYSLKKIQGYRESCYSTEKDRASKEVCKDLVFLYPAWLRALTDSAFPALPRKVSVHAKIVPKMETGGWKSVKVEQRSFTRAASLREQKRNKVSSDQQEKQSRVIIDSDEEIEGGFSCLIDVKETGIRNPILDVSKEETARILRKARRQKRKYCNPIIIN
ncbi:hypothetical protein POTOM_008394 [Populus tomentosa]|uniref:Uncharacterized protein n=1 Tax=Populus tomentosa TaxID=118781 RepID=A0A8X8ABX9_POPTO|nr:hypothetical protein POTOM_008394 [Populus tomentosa]